MRLLSGFCGALLFFAIGAGEALAACCHTAPPVHVYVPPPHVVIIPHTTYVHPVTPQVHAHTSNNSASAAPTVQAKQTPHHHVVQPIIVDTQTTPTSTRCKRPQGGQSCKKEDDQTGWATVRRWLQIGKQ
jgi:hypothetical protein